MAPKPTVYILHGDDEVGIKQFVTVMRERLGEAATADLNTTRMEGSLDLAAMKNAVRAVPIMAPRRLVVLSGMLKRIKSNKAREDFKGVLKDIHPATALVVVENEPLPKNHWLLNWGKKNPETVYEKKMTLPKGSSLVRWIRDYAGKAGGEITHEAAHHLVQMIGEDNRSAAKETDKLLAYANFSRPVDVDDVELLVAPVEEGDVFAMVDAIGGKDTRQALTMLHRLLSEREALSLFGMIIRQFRLLLQFKELNITGVPQKEIAGRIKVHEFVAGKLGAQARNYTLPDLENIYRKLIAVDEGIKTGKVGPETALDMLIMDLTAQG